MDYLPDTDTLSTTIDTDAGPSQAGGGQVADVAQPSSLRDDLEAAFKEDADKPVDPKSDDKADTEKQPDEKPAKDEAKPEKVEAKPDEETKPERTRAEDGKFVKPEGKDEQPKDGKRFVEPPKTFLPQAREVWRNTPHAVQAEVERLVNEHEASNEQTRASVDRYESLRQYDEVARSNGRDLRDSLEKMSNIEDQLQRNPIAGLNAILMEVGPRKADGQPFSLYEVAQYVAQQDHQGYQQMVAQGQPQQQPREDPRIVQLQQQLNHVQEQATHQTIIEPFARANPRYAELEGHIAQFLDSGMVPQSLSPRDRLAAAYDMAERINPPSHGTSADRQDGLAEPRRADDDFSGSRSIKSSLGAVSETYQPEAKGGESVGDSLRAEMRRLNR
jgi:hypothetical protein